MAAKSKPAAKKNVASKTAKTQTKSVRSSKSAPKKSAARKPAKKTVKKVPVKAAKKAAKKAPAKKKVSVKKPATTKVPPKKVPEKKATPKAAAKKAPVKNVVSEKRSAKKPSAVAKPPLPLLPRSKPGNLPVRKGKPEKKLSAKELRVFRQLLLNLRDKVVDGISFLSGDNLNRSQRDVSGDLSGYSLHMADQGTDNYDREFALNLVSSEQDILYEIDESIRRLDSGTFGVCELTGESIERARLKVIPYARFCVTAQSEMERGRTRYRPFGPTLTHGG